MKFALSSEQSTSLIAEQETPLIILESDKASLQELELRLETKLRGMASLS